MAYKPQKSDILYDDDEVRVYVKEQSVAGNLFIPIKLIEISLFGLRDALDLLSPADKTKLANRIIEDIKSAAFHDER